MKNYLDGIRALVRQLLRDESGLGITNEWDDDELDIYIGARLADISDARPYEVRESIKLAVNSIEYDVSDIEDLIEVTHAEYPVSTTPNPDLRNVSRFADVVRIKTDRRPSRAASHALGLETAYLYCHKMHTITESSSTLTPRLESLLVIGVAAKAANARSRTQVNKQSIGGIRVFRDHLTWAQIQEEKFQAGLRLNTKQRVKQLYPTA